MTKIRYPIRAVAKLTGLSLDTLRAWERRYQAVIPERGRRGRLYTEHDLERLHLLREVVSRGHAIGQVARLGDQDLRQFLEPRATEGKKAPRGGRHLSACPMFSGRWLGRLSNSTMPVRTSN